MAAGRRTGAGRRVALKNMGNCSEGHALLRPMVFAILLLVGTVAAASAETATAVPESPTTSEDTGATDPESAAAPGETEATVPESPTTAEQTEATVPESAAATDETAVGVKEAQSLEIAAADQADADTVTKKPAKPKKRSRPKAPSVDLNQPVLPPQPKEETTWTKEDVTEEAVPDIDVSGDAVPDIEEGANPESFVLLGMEVPAATSTRIPWSPTESFEGIKISTPVLVVNGAVAGPTLCLTAAVHGDELNGIEIVRRVMYNLNPKKLRGTVIGVPIVNLQGFHRNSRYLPDRRDLNRFFPGNPLGSSASRIAYSFFNEIIKHCDALVDLHTGSFHRTNLPQLRADLSHPNVQELTQQFGSTVTLNSANSPGTLRQAAVEAGIPAVTLEAGEPLRLQKDAVDHGVNGIQALLHNLDMYKSIVFWRKAAPIYYKSVWVRANGGGILMNTVDLGEKVDKGDILGTVTDPITNVSSKIKAPYDGRVLGMALNQVVLPGFAAYRIGIRSSQEEISELPEGVEEDTALDSRDIDLESETEEVDETDEDDLAAVLVNGEVEPSE